MQRRTLIRLGWLAGTFGVALSFLFAWIPAQAFYWQIYRGVALEKDLGFRPGSPYVSGIEVLTIEDINPAGILGRAGARDGDIPVDGLSITEFYRMLERSRGRAVTIRVVSGGNGPSVDRRAVRELTFEVPSANRN